MARLNLIDLIKLNTYWIGLSFMWNSLHIIVLPVVLLNYVPETQKNTYLGLLTFVGLIIAMIVQPYSGALSDRWKSRWGRRRPLILVGVLINFIFLSVLGWAGGLIWLAIGYFGLQISSNLAHGPAQGLLPDRVPPQQYGAASGIKNLMDMTGIVVASLLMGRLVAPQAVAVSGPMFLVIIVVAAAAAITLIGVREQPAGDPFEIHQRTPIIESLTAIIKSHSGYWWLIGSRFAFLLGVYDIQAFAQYYVRDVLDVSNPVQVTGDLMAAIALSLIAFALIGGWLGDRIGHPRTLLAASLVATIGCLLLMAARTPGTLLIYGSILGAGIGLFLTSNWAIANEMLPPLEAGKFLGLTNLATAGSGAAGRLAGPMIDLLNNIQVGAYWGYTAMFIFGAFCTFASGLLLMKALPNRGVLFSIQR